MVRDVSYERRKNHLNYRRRKRGSVRSCKEIKDSYDKGLSRIPIVIITAKNDDVDRVCGMAMGADAYLTKPFSLECLMNEILRLLPAFSF